SPRPQLPVLVLLNGVPGAPEDWFDQGLAADVADDYQRTHHGLAPIIAAVDSSGGQWKNPVCTDSPLGNVNTYLSVDIPQWLRTEFDATGDQSRWTIGGLSYGGTCALQIITNNSTAYGSFLDFSGEKTPNIGGNEKATIDAAFEGNEALFRSRNPEDIMSHRTFPHIHGRFVAGNHDTNAVHDLYDLNRVAARAGMHTAFELVPGGHTYEAWREALRRTFGFVVDRGQLPPEG
ncbi:alpha/beta hydrolase, partial [Corynebacterium heidelbergense]|uniref:alpha/beta hydrolase n=1 Tax=Corynebacterium heidelbergense TaxID=2055947 RepID=UPI0014022C03